MSMGAIAGLILFANMSSESGCCLQGGGGQVQARAIPLEQVIDDVVNMGFSRHEVSQSGCRLTPMTCLTGTTVCHCLRHLLRGRSTPFCITGDRT